jgi:hypothetical protein
MDEAIRSEATHRVEATGRMDEPSRVDATGREDEPSGVDSSRRRDEPSRGDGARRVDEHSRVDGLRRRWAIGRAAAVAVSLAVLAGSMLASALPAGAAAPRRAMTYARPTSTPCPPLVCFGNVNHR